MRKDRDAERERQSKLETSSEEAEGVRGGGGAHMCFPHILTVPPPPPTRPSSVQSAGRAAPLAAERESGMDQFDGIWR